MTCNPQKIVDFLDSMNKTIPCRHCFGNGWLPLDGDPNDPMNDVGTTTSALQRTACPRCLGSGKSSVAPEGIY
ncbi:MAG: hypothetical protein HQL76_09020 [Magnetococcales bacterium]|nr:hypothetical protein [Magnetococcales bacterium]